MTWKTSLIRDVTLIAKGHTAVWALLLMASCSTPGSVPKWDGDLWPGRPDLDGVARTEDDGTQRIMKCTDPAIKKGVWVSYVDLEKVFTIIQSCKKWSRGMPMMTAKEALRRLGPMIEDMQREAALEDAGVPPESPTPEPPKE